MLTYDRIPAYGTFSIRTPDGWNGLALKGEMGYSVTWSDGTEAFYSHTMGDRYIENGEWVITKIWEDR